MLLIKKLFVKILQRLNSLRYVPDFPVHIPNNSNLNNYTTPGIYWVPSNAAAVTLSNTPTGEAMFLYVEYSAGVSASDSYMYITQRVKTYNGYNYIRYAYTTNGGDTWTWDTWHSGVPRKKVGYIESTSTTLTAGATTWITINYPNTYNGSKLDGRDITYAGYYVNGSTNLNIFAAIAGQTYASFACKNLSNTSQTFTVRYYFAYV